jgi:hypothetical protein
MRTQCSAEQRLPQQALSTLLIAALDTDSKHATDEISNFQHRSGAAAAFCNRVMLHSPATPATPAEQGKARQQQQHSTALFGVFKQRVCIVKVSLPSCCA